MSPLLNCPFCGGPAREPIPYNGAMETGCAGPHDCPGTDVLVPVALWNRRAPPEQSAAGHPVAVDGQKQAEVAKAAEPNTSNIKDQTHG
jgi:hypothetical protein